MSDFGTQLKQARENRGISLRQIATSTKISVVALEALERGDFSRLPGGIFSRAFVRSYALEVGLNPDDVVAQFLVELGAATPAEDDTPRPDVTDDDRAFLERQRKAGLALRIGLAVLALVIIASVVAWQITRGAAPTRTPATDNSTAPASDSSTPPVPAAASADAGTPPAAEPAPLTGDGLRIEIIALDNCWLQATTDGALVPARVLVRGERQTLEARREVVLSLGSAGAVTWSINGRAARSLGRVGEVRSVTISSANATEFLQPPDARPTPIASATTRP
jgi:transcriptional regulator with XRE-family HTH domain